MPSFPLGPCTYPRCPNRATAGHGRCATHARQDRQRHDQARGTAAQRGYDGGWRAIRAEVLMAHPACTVPGCPQAAVDVHHDPPYVAGTAHRDYRLIPYCHAHHSSLTAARQSFGRARLAT